MQRNRTPKVSARLTWHGVLCRVSHQANFINKGWSQIEIEVIDPRGAPIPITDTGYRAHHLDEEELRAAGGFVAYFTSWLEREANTEGYARAKAKWNQLDLFGSAKTR